MDISQAQDTPHGLRSPEFDSDEHEHEEQQSEEHEHDEQQSEEHERDEEPEEEGFDHSELPTQTPSDQMPPPLGGSTQSTQG